MVSKGLYHNLEQRRNGWYVWFDVPPSLRPRIGRRRLRKTTGTTDRWQALLRRGPILQEFRMMLERERKAMALEGSGGFTGEALSWKREIEGEQDVERRNLLEGVLVDRAERIEKSEGLETAKGFYAVASGKAIRAA